MADKPLLKRIDDLSTPVFELVGQKGVNEKHLEKGYRLAFALFSCRGKVVDDGEWKKPEH